MTATAMDKEMVSVVQHGWFFQIELRLPGRPMPYLLPNMFSSREAALDWRQAAKVRASSPWSA